MDRLPLRHRVQRIAVRLTASRVFWVLLLLSAFAWPVGRSVTRELPAPAPVYGEVPAFELIDQDGLPFRRDDLLGKVWVANFIFTSCGEVCPRLSERMAEVQYRVRNLWGAVRLVSFSVDPERDTPGVLKAYGQRFHAREGLWSFLTGPLNDLESVIVDGFKLAVQRSEIEDTGFFDIVHGERIVLVDQEGRIRGYYRADDEGLQALLNSIGLLANLGPRGAEPKPAVSMVSS